MKSRTHSCRAGNDANCDSLASVDHAFARSKEARFDIEMSCVAAMPVTSKSALTRRTGASASLHKAANSRVMD